MRGGPSVLGVNSDALLGREKALLQPGGFGRALRVCLPGRQVCHSRDGCGSPEGGPRSAEVPPPAVSVQV
mgnify:CR=1 FL=1